MTNLKLVLRTYSALRQMSPDDIALLEILRALNDGDRELLLETMANKPATKKASKKSSKSSTKSPRASGMATVLNRNLKQQRAVTKNDDSDDEFPDLLSGHEPCAFEYSGGMQCGAASDANVHHLQSDSLYHPFISAASPAPVSSPANGGVVGESESASAASGD